MESKFLAQSVQHDSDDDIGEQEDDKQRMQEMQDEAHQVFGAFVDQADDDMSMSDEDQFANAQRDFTDDTIDGMGFNAGIERRRANGKKTTSTPFSKPPRPFQSAPQLQTPVRNDPYSPNHPPFVNQTPMRPLVPPLEFGDHQQSPSNNRWPPEARCSPAAYLRQEHITPQDQERLDLARLKITYEDEKRELLRQCNENISGITATMENWRTKANVYEKERDELRRELDHQKLQIGNHMATLGQYQERVRMLELQAQSEQQEKEQMKKNLYEASGRIESLKDQMAKDNKPQIIEGIRQNYEQNILHIKNMNEKNLENMKLQQQQELNKLKESHRVEVEKLDQQAKQYADQLHQLQYDEHNLKEAHTRLKAEYDKLKKCFEASGPSASKEQETIALLGNQIKQKDEENERLRSTMKNADELRQQVDNLRASLSAQEKENARLMDEVSNVRQECTQARESHLKAVDEISSLRRELLAVQDEKSGADRLHAEQIALLKGSISKLEANVRQLEKQKQEESTRLLAAQQQLQGAENQKQDTSSKVAALQQQVQELEQQKRSEISKVLTLQRQLGELENKRREDCARVLSLEQQLTGKDNQRMNRESTEVLRQKLSSKEKEIKDLTDKMHEVENRLYSQLKIAAEHNNLLTEEKDKLIAESHDTKRLLRKLRELTRSKYCSKCGTREREQPHVSHSGAESQYGSVYEHKYAHEAITTRGDVNTGESERLFQRRIEQEVRKMDASYTQRLREITALVKRKTGMDIIAESGELHRV